MNKPIHIGLATGKTFRLVLGVIQLVLGVIVFFALLGGPCASAQCVPPAITAQPSGEAVCGDSDSNVTFAATASGSPTPTVQWQISTNGGASFFNVVGATSTQLLVSANNSIPVTGPIFLILMENENWASISGNASAPYINNTVLPMASYATQYYNPPGMHPSEPNYLWLEAGTNFGVLNDDDPSVNSQTTTNHLVTQLRNAGISWRGYEESIPGGNCPLTSTGPTDSAGNPEYAVRHEPFCFFDDVTCTQNTTCAYCIANVVPYTQLAGDLASNTVARYNFLTPNLCDDMHDTCTPLSNGILQGDTWLSNNLPQILASQAYQNGGVVFITWDEGENGDGPLGMIVLSPVAKGGGYSNAIHYTHSSTLRTVQEILGVGPLLGDAANATDLSDLFNAGPSQNGDQYRALFTNSCGSVTSSVATLILSIAVVPAGRDFGVIVTGSTAQVSFVVTNPCGATLAGTAVVGGPPFAIASGSPFNIAGFGSTNVVVSFTPTSAGSFTDRVISASNGGISTNALTGSAAVAPTAGFSGTPTNGAATLLVNFTDASVGTVTSQVWAFGDGGTSTLDNPSHSYTSAGTFSVSLTVLGPLGTNMVTRSNYITVTSLAGAPIAGFIANPTNGAAPLLVNFTDASMGTITNHSWTFGDGNASTLTSPSHSYSTAGVYSVALTVSGPGGSGATNRVGLITVTNVVNTPPTVTIVRPANGMFYPPTNLVGIVASATANDGGAISKIEFFADGAKLGETNSNLGTNFLFNFIPARGTNTLTVRATDTLGATNTSSTATIIVGAKNSPLGDWEVTIRGADQGAQFLTFKDDFSANGLGIRLKTFGLDEVSGQWAFKTNNPKGQVTGPFVEQTDGVINWTGTFLGPVKSLKTLSGTMPATPPGTFHWRGIPATRLPELSGSWTGAVAVVRTTPVTMRYIFSANANDFGIFDIAESTDTNRVVGELLVTSKNKVYASVLFNDSEQLRLSGTYSPTRRTLTLRGTDTNGETVSVKLSQ